MAYNGPNLDVKFFFSYFLFSLIRIFRFKRCLSASLSRLQLLVWFLHVYYLWNSALISCLAVKRPCNYPGNFQSFLYKIIPTKRKVLCRANELSEDKCFVELFICLSKSSVVWRVLSFVVWYECEKFQSSYIVRYVRTITKRRYIFLFIFLQIPLKAYWQSLNNYMSILAHYHYTDMYSYRNYPFPYVGLI
jgi:hypothetical protein